MAQQGVKFTDQWLQAICKTQQHQQAAQKLYTIRRWQDCVKLEAETCRVTATQLLACDLDSIGICSGALRCSCHAYSNTSGQPQAATVELGSTGICCATLNCTTKAPSIETYLRTGSAAAQTAHSLWRYCCDPAAANTCQQQCQHAHKQTWAAHHNRHHHPHTQWPGQVPLLLLMMMMLPHHSANLLLLLPAPQTYLTFWDSCHWRPGHLLLLVVVDCGCCSVRCAHRCRCHRRHQAHQQLLLRLQP